MNTRVAFLLVSSLLLSPLVAAAELTVFAAASLADSFKEIAPLYTKASGDTVRFNFGASGNLARQIKEGAPADVIFSADELRLDQLAEAGLLLPDTRRSLLANTLVLIIPADRSAPASLAALTDPAVRRIALGIPATVPAGTYASDHLKKLSLWDSVQPKAVFLDNVRAVLAAVESGNVDAGIVYKTDALISKKIKISFEIPQDEGPAITYPVAVVKNTASPEAARRFVNWLAGAEARGVFRRHGFLAAP
ncbi:MAG: molybdate ABC transporter substrate-binding protein [Rariglobus sp.]